MKRGVADAADAAKKGRRCNAKPSKRRFDPLAPGIQPQTQPRRRCE